MDEIAERITTLGGTAAGTVAAAAQNSVLPAYPLDVHAGSDHIDAVATALSEFGKNVRLAIERAGDIGDADTEDLFVEVIAGHRQAIVACGGARAGRSLIGIDNPPAQQGEQFRGRGGTQAISL